MADQRHQPDYLTFLRSRISVDADGQLQLNDSDVAAIREQFNLPSAIGHPAIGASSATLPQRIRSLAAALLRWCRSGCPLTRNDLFAYRLARCAACHHWRPGEASGALAHCALCGCSTHLKLRLLTERCPAVPPRW